MNKFETRTRKPPWLRKRVRADLEQQKVVGVLEELGLNTVCDGARCPNKGECFSRGTATFMILGRVCTRNCAFCAVSHGAPECIDETEPERVAQATQRLGLKHVVVTSVTRDDLPDGGADQFRKTIRALRRLSPRPTVEVLTPDFKGDGKALERVIEAGPDVFNHNVETVPRLYPKIRRHASFDQSLRVLQMAKKMGEGTFTKSGFMVGLGEIPREVVEILEALRSVACDGITIGQYLQPSRFHHPVVRYVPPSEFEALRRIGETLGFSYVASGPFVRSSFNAEEMLRVLDRDTS